MQSEIVTIFCQGNGASRAQSAKYAGPLGADILTSDNKKISVLVRNAPLLAHNLHVYPELSDIGYRFTYNPIHWLMYVVHWLVMRWHFGFVKVTPHYSHLTEWNVGGDQDVAEYLFGVRDAIQLHPQKKLVLMGCSRGASTVLIAATRLSDEERRHVALVIAEGPFDTVDHVVHYRASFGGIIPQPVQGWLSRLALFLLRNVAKYDPKQESPLQAVSKWPKDLPLGIIRSRIDTIVGPECTKPLIKKLREIGHEKLHVLVLGNSHHGNMPDGDEKDRQSYERFTQKLYELYC